MHESPRLRRLRSDEKALQQLAADSTIVEFSRYGTPADFYIVRFHGRGFYRPDAGGEVLVREEHEVHIRLGASYPRMMPELAWKSPIFHPNISASGVVCLGGYGTYWVPSLALDELCVMLWDMIRFENYDEKSPYNREAAAWAKNQTFFRMPIDNRPLRDKLASRANDDAVYRLEPAEQRRNGSAARSADGGLAFGSSSVPRPAASVAQQDVLFLGEVVEAEAVASPMLRGNADIVFIE
jgi:ubiquitin-protein ligase